MSSLYIETNKTKNVTRKAVAKLKLSELESDPQGRFLVVSIGINKYDHWQRLKNAVNDAKGLQKTLIDYFGFQAPIDPIFDRDATNDAILSLEDSLRKELKPEDNLVFFFAGHGHTRIDKVGDEKLGETGFLVPVNANYPPEEHWSEYIELDYFLNKISNLPAKHILVILDSCYSGLALGKAINAIRGLSPHKQDISSRISRQVITSAYYDQPALDGGPIPGHSLFTGTLIYGLKSRKADLHHDGIITSSELGLFVQKRVGHESDSSQTPDFGSFYHDKRGEMVLYPQIKEEVNNQIETQTKSFTESLADNITIEMVLIPEGSFQMGSDKSSNEQPVREVKISHFFMSKYPVTQAQWKAVSILSTVKRQLDPEPSRFKGDNLPIERVSWYDAKEFCARLSHHSSYKYRLPSEAEWEYACHANSTTSFYFGETPTNNEANYNDELTDVYQTDEYLKATMPVDSFPPNAFGLYDLHGNVYEWCEDSWFPNYEKAPSNGTARQSREIYKNQSALRLLRGGAWVCKPKNCRCTFRNYLEANDRYSIVGFRIACNFAS